MTKKKSCHYHVPHISYINGTDTIYVTINDKVLNNLDNGLDELFRRTPSNDTYSHRNEF